MGRRNRTDTGAATGRQYGDRCGAHTDGRHGGNWAKRDHAVATATHRHLRSAR